MYEQKMKQLVLATNNQDKVQEFKALLGLEIELVTLDQFPQVGTITEDEHTLEGNALKKARVVFQSTRIPTLADDSGLEVHYLYGQPGVYSSRYAGENATYADNRKKLLKNLRGVPPRRRGARFTCVLAFVAPNNIERLAEGACTGVIVEGPRGDHGFGYDPIFVPVEYDKTFAEMEENLKNKLSHRAKAFETMRPILSRFFDEAGES
jgi:XTP/dITP diphosphohydrolase